MTREDHNPEIYKYPEKEFAEHISLEYNHRILFSGRFGVGKTSFLEYFFKDEDSRYREQYNVIHLFPVNYQVSDNKDIFEYIKYDIIANLLTKKIDFEKIDIPAFTTVVWKLMNRPADVLSPILHMLGGLPGAGGLGNAYDKAMTLVKEVSAEHKKISDESNDEEALLSFLEEAKQQQGSIYERDFYTELIVRLLQQWKSDAKSETPKGEGEKNKEDPSDKESEPGKKNVLIVDDLDRIDPQHAFRLFNVFAAHFDQREGPENKFGFDKVIFVCDVQNIRNIFAHNYGSEVDFSGYIDKFFSTRVYQFDNAEAVKRMIGATIRSSNYMNALPHDNRSKERVTQHLEFILNVLIDLSLINLRVLFKMSTNHNMLHTSKMLRIGEGSKFESKSFVIVVVLDFLLQIMGSTLALQDVLKKCEYQLSKYPDLMLSYDTDWLLPDVIAFLGYKHHNWESHEHHIPEEKIVIDYRMQDWVGTGTETVGVDIIAKKDENGENIENGHRPNIFMMQQKALQKMINHG